MKRSNGPAKERHRTRVSRAFRPWLSEGLIFLGWVVQGREVVRQEREDKRRDGTVYVFEAWLAWIQSSIVSALLLTAILAFLTFGFDIDMPVLIAMALTALFSAFISSVVLGLSALLGASEMSLGQDLLIAGIVAAILFVLGIPQRVVAEPLWSYYS